MDDLISRQAAIDALGDKPLAWTEGEYELGLQTQWQSDVDALKEVPSAEPEIIRCKNCIWFDRYTDGIEKYQWDGFCAEWARNTYENWYCGRAERR